jgi:hypothetical protein
VFFSLRDSKNSLWIPFTLNIIIIVLTLKVAKLTSKTITYDILTLEMFWNNCSALSVGRAADDHEKLPLVFINNSAMATIREVWIEFVVFLWVTRVVFHTWVKVFCFSLFDLTALWVTSLEHKHFYNIFTAVLFRRFAMQNCNQSPCDFDFLYFIPKHKAAFFIL